MTEDAKGSDRSHVKPLFLTRALKNGLEKFMVKTELDEKPACLIIFAEGLRKLECLSDIRYERTISKYNKSKLQEEDAEYLEEQKQFEEWKKQQENKKEQPKDAFTRFLDKIYERKELSEDQKQKVREYAETLKETPLTQYERERKVIEFIKNLLKNSGEVKP